MKLFVLLTWKDEELSRHSTKNLDYEELGSLSTVQKWKHSWVFTFSLGPSTLSNATSKAYGPLATVSPSSELRCHARDFSSSNVFSALMIVLDETHKTL
jgi:hypothetical protein